MLTRSRDLSWLHVGFGMTRIDKGYGLKVNPGEPVAADAVPPQLYDMPIKTEVFGPIRKR